MKKKIKWTALFLALVLFAVGIVAILKNSHYLYIFGEYLGVNCDEVELKKSSPENMKKIELKALKADDRVKFDQSLMLINSDHPLKDNHELSLSEYKDTGVQLNKCLNSAYGELSEAVFEKTGSKLFISSSYRTQEEQQELYDEDPSTANIPGTSEHQSGLGIDVYVQYYAGFGFIKTDAGQFINSNCWKYGFIIRYPSYGKDKTGMKFEPWHIRYVGKPHAKVIYNNHLTLEEYIESLKNGVWYKVDDTLISRQKTDENGRLSLPDSFKSAVISPDNTGSYIITINNAQTPNDKKSSGFNNFTDFFEYHNI